MASGMISRSPSPAAHTAQTQALLQSPSPPPQHNIPLQSSTLSSSSPKLHSLPDNALNPLGLLVEASEAKRRANGITTSFIARPTDGDSEHRLGVASDNFFRPGFMISFQLVHAAYSLPGPMSILPLRRLYIERQVQPEMLSFVSTEEVVALFNMLVLCILSYLSLQTELYISTSYFDHMNVSFDARTHLRYSSHSDRCIAISWIKNSTHQLLYVRDRRFCLRRVCHLSPSF